MPTAAPKPCVRCGVLVHDGRARCLQHRVREGTFADKRRGTRHERGYGAEWDRRRLRVLARDKGICQIGLRAGRVHAGGEVDHIVPKAQGGTDDEANLQTACRICHRAKTQAEAGGAKNSTAERRGTDPCVNFLRAQVSGVGGVDPWARYREAA